MSAIAMLQREIATLRADLARAREEVANLLKERDEWTAALQKVCLEEVPPIKFLCGWCGIPAWSKEDVHAHAEVCQSNPVVQRALAAERARDEAVAEVARLKEALRAAQTALGDAHYWFKRAAGGPRADYTMECRTGEAEYAARRAMAGEGA